MSNTSAAPQNTSSDRESSPKRTSPYVYFVMAKQLDLPSFCVTLTDDFAPFDAKNHASFFMLGDYVRVPLKDHYVFVRAHIDHLGHRRYTAVSVNHSQTEMITVAWSPTSEGSNYLSVVVYHVNGKHHDCDFVRNIAINLVCYLTTDK